MPQKSFENAAHVGHRLKKKSEEVINMCIKTLIGRLFWMNNQRSSCQRSLQLMRGSSQPFQIFFPGWFSCASTSSIAELLTPTTPDMVLHFPCQLSGKCCPISAVSAPIFPSEIPVYLSYRYTLRVIPVYRYGLR